MLQARLALLTACYVMQASVSCVLPQSCTSTAWVRGLSSRGLHSQPLEVAVSHDHAHGVMHELENAASEEEALGVLAQLGFAAIEVRQTF